MTSVLHFVLYTLHVNTIIKIVPVKGGLPLYGFCVDMPEDNLSTGRNIRHTLKCN